MQTGPTGDTAASIMSMQQELTQTRAGLAVLKVQRQSEERLIAMLDATATAQQPAPPAPGTGLVVDKSV
ncbi:MAG: hypothetical protein ACOYOJ_14225 [Alsobacter sp.]